MGQGLSSVRARLSALRSSVSAYITGLRDVDDTQKLAAGSVGNLTAQFNDIGIMMAAGQNPLQLAIQQGTQITQVIGPMGASGAVRALGQAFVGLLSPVNLVTIGSIAAGAAMVQWLSSSSEDAKTLKEQIDDLNATTKAYRTSVEQTYSDLVKVYGSASAEVQALHRDTQALLREDVERQAAQAGNAVVAVVQETKTNLSAAMMQLFGPDQNAALQGTDHIVKMAQQFAELREADGIEHQLDLIGDLKAGILSATGGFRQMNAEQLAVYQSLRDAEDALRQAVAARLAEEANSNREKVRALALYGRSRAESDRELAKGRELLTQIQEEAALQRIVAIHGADSVEAAEARWAIEEKALQTQLDGLEISQSLKDEIMDAAQAAFDAEDATARWADQMVAVRSEVAAILSDLASLGGGAISNAAKAAELQALQEGKSIREAANVARDTKREAEFDAREQGASWFGRQVINFERGMARYGAELDDELDAAREAARERDRTAKGGGRQIEALDQLIRREQLELDILRQTDPLQKELLRHRDLLAGATQAQRDALADLIGQQIEEKDAIDAARDAQDLFASVSFNAMQGLLRDGASAVDMLKNLAAAIGDAALQAAFLGEGPLAGVFGAQEGGWLGTIVSAILPAAATGGYLAGPGSGTSDDILMWGSSGEFMVNAKATRKHRTLLEMINAGMDFPMFATGGLIGGPPVMTGGGAAAMAAPVIEIANYGSTPVQGEAEHSTDGNGRRRVRLVLADQVGQAIETPGGGARRVLRDRYGVTPRGTRR
ncbi:hypothetical protein FGK63_01735 [Ruegeria sediminis]|uniref:Bacteriophage tail tape measure N-terminal domain-containing protein n=2 Tax=Ruegeria sediminis TaxID=2583820 RepID=A0ABY2X4Q2_9RHOB|nr:hypothetical protein FGK63_01735 [Ruegeria sediminis]